MFGHWADNPAPTFDQGKAGYPVGRNVLCICTDVLEASEVKTYAVTAQPILQHWPSCSNCCTVHALRSTV